MMVKGYIFKKGLLWLGWIMLKEEQKPILYYDNKPV